MFVCVSKLTKEGDSIEPRRSMCNADVTKLKKYALKITLLTRLQVQLSSRLSVMIDKSHVSRPSTNKNLRVFRPNWLKMGIDNPKIFWPDWQSTKCSDRFTMLISMD